MALNPNAQKWVAALRSGEYSQATQALRGYDDVDNPSYCCLGVACDIFAKEHPDLGKWDDNIFVTTDGGGDEDGGYTIDLPPVVREWLGVISPDADFIPVNEYDSLVDMNDAYKLPFTVIADMIELEPEGLFAQS